MRWKQCASAVVVAVAAVSTAAAQSERTPDWVVQDIPSSASLRGVCAISDRIAWVSGAGGTVLRTTDGGETWGDVSVADAASLDFRDIQAFDADTAIVISAGEPACIYKTHDAGETWSQRYANDTPGIFFDAMAFWDREHGLAFSDPIEGRLVIIHTDDGGETWSPIDPQSIPATKSGEAGFAASGTCLATLGESHAWIGTGGSAARVFCTDDRGRSWRVVETPMRSGEASMGIFSLAFRDEQHGVAVGGNYTKPDESERNVAITSDGGKTWTTVDSSLPRGYRSAVAIVPKTDPPLWVTVGTSGSDYSLDDGRTWKPIGDDGFNAISFAPDGAGWAVGADGRVARFKR